MFFVFNISDFYFLVCFKTDIFYLHLFIFNDFIRPLQQHTLMRLGVKDSAM